MIHLVRHADAGHRGAWGPDDRRRPLSEVGVKQAHLLTERLAGSAPAALITSPYVRCRQTLEPLAERLGVSLEEHDSLVEGGAPEPVVDLIHARGGDAVLCSHGDVLGSLIGHLAAAGAPIDPTVPFAKGATWEVVFEGYRATSARFHGPLA